MGDLLSISSTNAIDLFLPLRHSATGYLFCQMTWSENLPMQSCLKLTIMHNLRNVRLAGTECEE
ncbi:MAG TPA: hypothetical protein DDW52_10565 [Planctomycetaceae bacterium]|nr:hypothetical protein [Planctomycetaceae bacterium]